MKKEIIKPVFRLCYDWSFKEIFSKVPNALAGLISEALGIDYSLLENNIQIERSELNKEKEDNKTTICDFVVKIEENFKLDIEINTSKYKGLEERNFLFVCRLFSNMIPKGTKYQDFVNYKVAQLNINRFKNINDKVLSKTMLTDVDTNIPVFSSLFFYNFDIVKSKNIYYNNNKCNEKVSKLVRWGAILETDKTEDIADIMGDDLMSKKDKEKFIETVNNLKEQYTNFTKEQLEQHEEFKLEGIRLSGIEQGIEQGTKQVAKQTTINMLNKNLDIKLISEITGLNEEEIIEIKNTL